MLVGAVLSALISASLYLSQANPELATKLWPGNSIALGNLAVNNTARSLSLSAMEISRQQALRVLRVQPGNVRAVRAMAVIASATGRDDVARRWLDYGEQQSRRDAGTQLFLIEYEVNRGDPAGALRHYDRALRTSPEVYPQLFPILSAAAANPSIRNPLATILKQRPFWRRFFLSQFVAGPTGFDVVAPVMQSLRLNSNDPEDRDILKQFVIKGVAENRLTEARRFVLGSSGYSVRNGGFEAVNAWPPFDWQIVDDAELGAVIEQSPKGNGNALFLDARNGRTGNVARQALVLPEGRYRLTLTAGDISGVGEENPLVTLTCAGLDRPASAWRLPTVPATGKRLSYDLAIPTSCSSQWLAIDASAPAGADSTARPWIDDVMIEHAA